MNKFEEMELQNEYQKISIFAIPVIVIVIMLLIPILLIIGVINLWKVMITK
jgi:hypothetical protein